MVHSPQWVNQCSLPLTLDPLTFQFVIHTVQNPQSTPNKLQNCLTSGEEKEKNRGVSKEIEERREREQNKSREKGVAGRGGRGGERREGQSRTTPVCLHSVSEAS